MNTISKNLKLVNRRLIEAAQKCGRDPSGIRLIAVSKTNPAGMIKEAFDAGQHLFGENYVQEFKAKAEDLADCDIEWHFIGHLQRNKVKHITPIVTCIHSIDSVRLAEEVEKRAEKPIDCFIEVNLAGEKSKTGLDSEKADELVKAIASMEKLNLIGLMTMPPFDSNPEKSRPYFIRLRELLNDINRRQIYPKELTELSMGMTGDLEVAIEEGATFVRVGTAIFGGR